MAEQFPLTFPIDFGEGEEEIIEGLMIYGDGKLVCYGNGRIIIY